MFLTIFITFAMSFIVSSTNLIGKTSLNKDNKTNKTYAKFIHDNTAFQINAITGPLLTIFIPYLLVLVLNIIVILRLRPRKKGETMEEAGSRNIMNEFTVSTISVDLIFLVYKAPNTFIQIFYYYFSSYIFIYDFFFVLLMDIFKKFSDSYSDLLFFIFFFYEASFRKEIIKIFQLLRRFFSKLFRSFSKLQFL